MAAFAVAVFCAVMLASGTGHGWLALVLSILFFVYLRSLES